MNRWLCCLAGLAVPWAGSRALLSAPVTAPAATAPAPRELLEAIPADAAAFLVVRDAKALSDKLVTFARQLGLPVGPEGPIRTPMTMFKEHTGLDEGLIESASVALAALPAEGLMLLPQRCAALVPTHDFGRLIAPLKPEQVAEGMFAVTFAGVPTMAGRKGRFAVFSPNQATLEAFLQSRRGIVTRLSGARLKRFDEDDVFLWIDGARASAIVEPLMKVARTAATRPAADAPPGAEVIMRQYLSWFEMLTEGLDTFQLRFGIEPRGLTLSLYADARPGTSLAEMMAAARLTDQSLLFALPAERYVVACGQRLNPQQLVTTVQSIDAFLDSADVKAITKPNQLAKVRAAVRELLTTCRAWSLGISALPGGQGGLLCLAVACQVEDANQWISHLSDLATAMPAMFAEDVQPVGASQAIEYRRGAEQIGGVSCDYLVVNLAKLPEVTPEDIANAKKIVGMDGVVLRVAAVGRRSVVMALGGGKERMAQIIKLASTGAAPLKDDPGIKRISGYMAGSRTAEVYVAVDQLVGLLNEIAAVTGESLPLELAQIGTPIGIVASGGERHAEVELFVPTQLIVGLRDLVMQYLMMGQTMPMPTTAPAPVGF